MNEQPVQDPHAREQQIADYLARTPAFFERHAELLARVRSLLRVKHLYDRVEAQAKELATWNESLEKRVAEEVARSEKLMRLKRFLSPQLADLIVAGGAEDPLPPPFFLVLAHGHGT